MNSTSIKALAEKISSATGIAVEHSQAHVAGGGESAVLKEITRYSEAARVSSDPDNDAAFKNFATFFSRLDSLQGEGFRVSRIELGAGAESIRLVLAIGHAGYKAYHPDLGEWEVDQHSPSVGREMAL